MKNKKIFAFLSAELFLGFIVFKRIKNRLERSGNEEEDTKEKLYYELLSQWLHNKNNGTEIASRLNEKGFHNIAIYGMGNIGGLLYDDIKKSTNIKVAYAIDEKADYYKSVIDEFPIIQVDAVSEQEAVDAIVVTATNFYSEIKEKLEKIGVMGKIISLEELIY